MPKRKSVKKTYRKNPLKQSLIEDYWEGYYTLGKDKLVKLEDNDIENAKVSVFDLSDGKKEDVFTFRYKEESTVSDISTETESRGYGKIGARISDSAANPDREEMIESALNSGETFEIVAIRDLIKRLKTRSITVCDVPFGNKRLADEDYEGFYLLQDKSIAYCREADCTHLAKGNRIADGEVQYYILNQKNLGTALPRPRYFPYLDEDLLADLFLSLENTHGTAVSVLAVPGDELFPEFIKALNGDTAAASLVRHRANNTAPARQKRGKAQKRE